MLNYSEIPVIVISGTNASGKSSLGIELAQKYNGEIISADSRQIFNDFDLCCGKVNAEEKAIVPHHMIDICTIGDYYSVSDYQKQVRELIPQIHARGKLPFIVGGTGMYIDAVVKGFSFEAEEPDPEYRSMLEQKSISELQAMLSEASVQYLIGNHSDYNNKRRLIRVLEKERSGNSLLPNNHPLEHVLQLGVTWPKEKLHERIDQRLEMRLQQGMLEEVRSYLAQGGNPQYLYDLGLEYKYIAWYLEGKYATIEEFSAAMSCAIKQFAKRQVKWFRRNPDIHWIDMTEDFFSESCELIDAFLGQF